MPLLNFVCQKSVSCRISITLALIVLQVFHSSVASAQTSPTEEPEEELTVTGRELNKPIYSPFRQEGTVRDATRPAYVITKEEIQAQGARTVREALKFLPGILGDGTVGTEVNALSGQFIRGSNPGQVLILLDGRPVNNLGSGGFDLSEISTDIIERVEVLPGGGSTLYGSDAIGGIINIITTRPTGKPSGNIRLQVGNLGYNEQGISIGGKVGNASLLLDYNRVQAQNNYKFSVAGVEGKRTNNDVIYNNVRSRIELDLNPRSKLSLNVLYLPKEQGSPGGIPVPNPIFGQGFFNSLTDNNRKYTDQVLSDLNWQQKLGAGEDSTLTARVYLDFLNTRFDSKTAFAETLSASRGLVTSAITPQTQRQFDTRQRSLGFQLQHSWQFAKSQSITYGVDYRNTGVQNTIKNLTTEIVTRNYDDQISQGAVFAQYVADITPNLRTTIGLRQDFSSLAEGSATTPAIGLKWNLGDTTLRANYIRNFRTPTLLNLFSANPTNIGNPDLKPEVGDSFDAGVDQKLGSWGLLRLTAFQNTISNVIAFQRIAPPVDGISGTYENIGLVRTRGIEASLNLRLARNIYAFANYTINDPEIRRDANPSVVGKELRFAGADKLGLGVSYENTQGWYVGLLMNSLGSYPTDNLNTESLPGYTTFDFRFLVPLLDRRLALSGGVENIFAQRFELFAGFPDAGRTFRTGLNWQF